MKVKNKITVFNKLKAYFKYIASIVIMNTLKIFWILPINKNRILFFSFDGKQYSDNPKYISQYLHKRLPNKEIVWAFLEPQKFKYLEEKTYHLVQRKGVQFIKEFVTAKIIVTNNHVPTYLPLRDKQILLNTWHGGSPLKTVGFSEKVPVFYNKFFYKMQNRKYSAFLSSSAFMTEEVFNNSFGYKGNVLNYGMPRNAMLLGPHKEIINKVYKYFGIEQNNNYAIVLYAPTFRGDFRSSRFLPSKMQFDVEKCIECLNQKFKKKFKFLFRAHHTMSEAIEGNSVIMATDYPDMQELLCAADVLITDYSSCMGDMSLMKKPTFLYVPDLENYTQERGFYWDIHSLPFPISQNQNEFYNSIIVFNQKNYEREVDEYLLRLGTYESPESVEKTVSWIINKAKQ